MKRLLSYVLTAFFWAAFIFLLLIFHPIQMLALKLGGYSWHKRSVEFLNLGLLSCLRIIGGKMEFICNVEIPEDVPLIMVSNHQSMMDIPPFVWFMRKYHPKFVSKIELSKGIPSVSYNLRHGGSVLIDRKDGKQSLKALMTFGKYIEKNNYSAVIFPEGTRSKTGVPKRFSENGLKMLIKQAPSAYIVPVSINNSWKMFKHGGFPIDLGIKMSLKVHEPFAASSISFEEFMVRVENAVLSGIK